MDDTAGRMKDDAIGRADETARGYAGSAEPDRRTREIREEIEETRGEMTETIDAIQEKLKPRNIMANATDRVKSATTERVREMADSAAETAQDAVNYTREAASDVAQGVRQNPIPLALIGAGALWLLADRSNRQPGRSRASRNRDLRDDDETWTASGSMRRTARRTQNRVQRMIQDNPLLVGAGALMLGAAFGLAVPETETENELMGDTRDSLVGRAQGMARDAANTVKEAAGDVADAAGRLAGRTQP